MDCTAQLYFHIKSLFLSLHYFGERFPPINGNIYIFPLRAPKIYLFVCLFCLFVCFTHTPIDPPCRAQGMRGLIYLQWVSNPPVQCASLLRLGLILSKVPLFLDALIFPDCFDSTTSSPPFF